MQSANFFFPMRKDALARDGAMRLKGSIETYWRERGYIVTVWLEHVQISTHARGAHLLVRRKLQRARPAGVL